ncbi:MAG: 2-hydroxychromene-2-carboxylate isomerase [Burkholderiales bacterium]|nr:2-hydroxychromene-2-carboxylate isomerase [Burkholderiales bacterium]
MSKTVEFFFDVGSPTAYLAWTQLPKLCAETGATLVYQPMLLGAVFQATGNVSPAAVPVKGNYMTADLTRFAKRYGVPFAHNPSFPINTLVLMRGAVGVQLRLPERFDAYLKAVFTALWVEQKNLGDPAVLMATLAAAGFDPAAMQALVAEPAVKDTLRANTEAAVARGVFGAPTMFVGETMFFGQDRLDFVREALL